MEKENQSRINRKDVEYLRGKMFVVYGHPFKLTDSGIYPNTNSVTLSKMCNCESVSNFFNTSIGELLSSKTIHPQIKSIFNAPCQKK